MRNNNYALLKVLLFYWILQYNVKNLLVATNKCGRPIGSYNSGKIVGGYDIGYYKYPWYVALMMGDEVYCGGTLISSKHIVTAAHCFQEFFKAVANGRLTFEQIFTPTFGIYNVCQSEDTQKKFAVAKVHVHERYKKMDPYYDIALIRLKQSAKGFEPCCLPRKPLNSRTRPREGFVAGLGDRKYNSNVGTCTVHEARILIYNDDVCRNMLDSQGEEGNNLEHAFCAGYLEGGIDACQGDSGGPLIIATPSGRFDLLGITSFGFECAKPGTLGLYTDVTHYLDWIREKMKGPSVSQINSTITAPHTTEYETSAVSDSSSKVTSSPGSVNWNAYPATPWILSFLAQPFSDKLPSNVRSTPKQKHRKSSSKSKKHNYKRLRHTQKP